MATINRRAVSRQPTEQRELLLQKKKQSHTVIYMSVCTYVGR